MSLVRIAALLVVCLTWHAPSLRAEPFKVFVSDFDAIENIGSNPFELSSCDVFDYSVCRLPCECCSTSWTAKGQALLMHRGRPDGVILMADTATSTDNVAGSDFGFGWQSGWEAAIERHRCGGWNWELRLLEIDGWDSNLEAFNGPPVDVRLSTAVPIIVGGVTSGQATGATELSSFEFNLRKEPVPCVEVLVGMRYLELDDGLHFRLDAAPTPTTYDLTARNRLYGFQTGLDIDLLTVGCLEIDGVGKAGVYHNSGGHSSVLNTGVTSLLAADSADKTSFVGEVSLTGRYTVYEHLDLTFSYNLLWVETAALGTEQVTKTDFAAGTGIDLSGRAFFHGASLGIEYRH